MGKTELDDVTNLTRDQMVPYYVHLIIREPSGTSQEVVRVNNLIISKWSSSGLSYIKNKAWAIVNKPNRQPSFNRPPGKTERKDGYYYIKRLKESEWEPAKWIAPKWTLFGSLGWDDDNDLYQIGPRIPEYKPKKRKK